MSPRDHTVELSAELLLRAYAAGIFPMAERRDDPHIFWVDPKERGILPLDGFHIPKRLKRTVRRGVFEVACNRDFEGVIERCAETSRGRNETWINEPIRDAVIELNQRGFAHSVETYKDGQLVGGLYGVSLGGAFFGESMFSRATDASKVALVHLVARLRLGHFKLLDTQFVTDHLKQFGVVEIPARHYLTRLESALHISAVFPDQNDDAVAAALEEVLSGN